VWHTSVIYLITKYLSNYLISFKWATYFKATNVKSIFFSAAVAQNELDAQDEVTNIDDIDVTDFGKCGILLLLLLLTYDI